MAYDFHLSLVATGCVNGEITVYDFEMSKVTGILIAHTDDITALTFLSPYPLLASASVDLTVCIWGVRPISIKYLNVCIQRFHNYSWNLSEDKPCTVTQLLFWHEASAEGVQPYQRLPGKPLEALMFRQFEQNVVFAQRSIESIFKE